MPHGLRNLQVLRRLRARQLVVQIRQRALNFNQNAFRSHDSRLFGSHCRTRLLLLPALQVNQLLLPIASARLPLHRALVLLVQRRNLSLNLSYSHLLGCHLSLALEGLVLKRLKVL